MKLTKKFWIKMIPIFFMVIATIILSVAGYDKMMEMEKESGWVKLEFNTYSTAEKIRVRLDDNINFLYAVSDSHILTQDINDTKAVGKYLNSVVEMTIFERIDIILPDNSLITQDGEIAERSGKLTYDELVKKGIYISGRRTSSFTGKEVICCVMPIENEGEILGLLVGTIDCQELGELFEVSAYGDEAQIFLIDCEDGNYIIDNWHDELGNIYELGERQDAETYEMIDMVPAIINREKARFAFISATNGNRSYQYCTPVEGYNWELCVVVQEDVVFENAYQLSNILFWIAVIELIMVSVYMAWNVWLTIGATKSENKAKNLEYDKIKNEARTKFLSNMSHDIRTPLNGIVGMLQVIENHRDDEEMVNNCLNKIKVSTQYLSTLASDMLDINEIESNKLVLQNDYIDLQKFADDLGVMLEQKAQEVSVKYHMDCSNVQYPHVIGSSVHIKRILVNLIGNAIKYSKDTGKNVWVSITDEDMFFEKGKRKYKFIVKDNGIGMTEEFQKNMYNAFEQEKITARSSYQGYGLGLTIVNYLVKKMGGDIELESQKGVGSTFTVTIPLRLDESKYNQPEEGDDTIELEGMKILVVEDNELNMEIAQMILTDAGATVSTAGNGHMAVERFAISEPGTYDLILMDIMMPIMDGCEATKFIRSMDRSDAQTIPIIAMTAHTFSEEVKRCEEAGMNAHIAKPLDVGKLMAEVAKYRRT